MSLPKLPTRPTEAMRDAYVSRILAMYERATPAQCAEGHGWYPMAHDIASECGDVVTGAGVMAALSANKGWPQNVSLARRAFRGDVGGHTGDVLGKVHRILAGTDPTEVLPMTAKTGHFYRCIVNPIDPEAVVIDRHAHDIVAGMKFGNADRGLDNPNRYESIADAYRTAGHHLSLVPAALQAIVWVVITELARNDRKLTGVAGWEVADA